MGFPLGRAIRIASLGLPFIPGIGVAGAIAAGIANKAANEFDKRDPDEEKRKLEDENDKEWVKFSEQLVKADMTNDERAAALKNRIRVDLLRESGELPPDAWVNLFAENVVAVAKLKQVKK